MRNKIIIISLIAVILLAILAGIFYWKNLRGIGPVINPPEESDINSQDIGNTTGFPLKLPDGFSIEVFAKDLPGVRVMEFDTFGNMWVSQTGEGLISLIEIQDGSVSRQYPVLRNLNNPHGLVFDPEFETLLYYAEEDKVSSVPTYSDGGPQKLFDLPSGGGHFTRTLGIGPDNRIYVSIGSSCNVCNERDSRRAKIFVAGRDGSELKEYARGLRNSVFFAWHPRTKKMWATEMGRDLLGDDTPPDEINIIEEGKNYGWPVCYGKNVHDSDFDKNTYIRNPCMDPFEIPSHIDLQAHSAPLGLAFVPEDGKWPAEYKNDLIVAFHGSWNRSQPTGYKLVRVNLGREGTYENTEDFITGWLSGKSSTYGRPVDVKFGPDGNLYVSDDKAGVIYRIRYGR